MTNKKERFYTKPFFWKVVFAITLFITFCLLLRYDYLNNISTTIFIAIITMYIGWLVSERSHRSEIRKEFHEGIKKAYRRAKISETQIKQISNIVNSRLGVFKSKKNINKDELLEIFRHLASNLNILYLHTEATKKDWEDIYPEISEAEKENIAEIDKIRSDYNPRIEELNEKMLSAIKIRKDGDKKVGSLQEELRILESKINILNQEMKEKIRREDPFSASSLNTPFVDLAGNNHVTVTQDLTDSLTLDGKASFTGDISNITPNTIKDKED